MKNSFLLLLLVLLGCSHQPKTQPVRISLINSQRSLKFTGLDAAILGEIGRDSSTAVWQCLLPVYRMPADTDMKDFQHAQPGQYLVNGDAVVFTPDTPFTARQSYFVRYYLFGQGNTPIDYLKGHKKPGTQPYIDLIFKQ